MQGNELRSLVLLFKLFLEVALFVAAKTAGSLALGGFYKCERGFADRAGFLDRLIPKDEVALRVVGTAVEHLSAT